ncbi:Uncharacterized protein COCOBI_mt-0470 (mitochondrion) [Coccomyxa sp. Obi]|nr:Uncharacterized protein COCOBI_mt-0470 [Coccomyxa sp. Obi]
MECSTPPTIPVLNSIMEHCRCNLFEERIYFTPHLNGFRRKPAISEFDWLFTPSHKSSLPIATDTGSVLQKVLPPFQPAHS